MFYRVNIPVGAIIHLPKKTSASTSTLDTTSTSTSSTSQVLTISFPTNSLTKFTSSTSSSKSIQSTVTFFEETLKFIKSPLLKMIIILLLILLFLISFFVFLFYKMKKIKIDWSWKRRKFEKAQEDVNTQDLTNLKAKTPKRKNKYGFKKETCIELMNLTSLSNTTLLDDDQYSNFVFQVKKSPSRETQNIDDFITNPKKVIGSI